MSGVKVSLVVIDLADICRSKWCVQAFVRSSIIPCVMVPVETYGFYNHFCIELYYYRIIDTAANQLTKTTITVTAIFIVALGYELWHYLLYHIGVTDYIFFSVKQKVGKCFNSYRDSLLVF